LTPPRSGLSYHGAMTSRASALVVFSLLAGLSGVAAQTPPDASALVQQGRRLVADGQFAEALALYDQALGVQPGLTDAHLAAGIVLDLMGRYEEARRHLTQAIERASPELKANTLNAMAISYAFERRTADAAAFFRQVYDFEQGAGRPGAAAAAANALGRLYLETGDVKKARQWYQTGYEMARRQPDEPASQLALWELRWLHAQGRMAARARDGVSARRHVEAARQLIATTPALKDEGPTVAYLAGYVALYTGDVASARSELAKADQRDPFNLMLQAEAAEKAGDKAAAQAFWKQILTLNGHGLQHALSRPVAQKKVR
jgi:tetratricopeptide (TPR) repeat protein